MYLIFNTYACGGNANRKWDQIKNDIQKKFNELKLITINNYMEANRKIKDLLNGEEKDFIIAGGDGTVSFFINNLIDSTNAQEIKKFRVGAIGIGSSNDFHKPIKKENLINKIPAKINFNDFQPRDVGVIKYRAGNQILHKYFLLNASIGITASANHLFNKPDLILKLLKKHFTAIAIVYAALKTILTYKNFEGEIIFSPYEAYSFHFSNLSILKNLNISGDLSYPGKADYQNGLYDVYLTHSMNKFDLINLLKCLSKQTFPKNEKTKFCKTSKLKVTAAKDFLIEFDGETISTNNAEFSILNKYLNICAS